MERWLYVSHFCYLCRNLETYEKDIGFDARVSIYGMHGVMY